VFFLWFQAALAFTQNSFWSDGPHFWAPSIDIEEIVEKVIEFERAGARVVETAVHA